MKVENAPKAYDKNDRGQSSCQYYVTFCTKYNRKVFTDDYKRMLNTVLADTGVAEGFKITEIITGPDTVQCIVECPPDISIQKCVNQIKTTTAKEMHRLCPELKTRMPQMWTRKSFISTMGDVTLNSICDYINGQRKE